MRIDLYLFKNGYCKSREEARKLIKAHYVKCGDVVIDKPSYDVTDDAKLEVINPFKYVSRGGDKLEAAISHFGIDVKNCICVDIGASTGGFTDCMLQNGAKKVYSVDVGYGQLAWKLRNDERVVCMEKTNFRYLTRADIQDDLDFASVDVSFISLKIILPVLRELLKTDGEAVCLIKPQFEAGKENVGKKGVVRDKMRRASRQKHEC